jgi:tetratricopeptide (TPR) repeat protein
MIASASLLLLLATTYVHAQDTGVIDTRAAVERRIRELEGLVQGDAPVARLAVTLRWLADLYVSVGRIDDAEFAYQRILAYYPFDAATSNAYGDFLMNTRQDPERAEKVLRDAIARDQVNVSPSPHVGQTYALHAHALAEMGKCEEALSDTERAVALAGDDIVEDALRTRVRCLSELGRDKDAKQTLLALIGATGNSSADDHSTLVALLGGKKKRVDEREVQRVVSAAIDDARTQRAEALAREKAKLVEITSEGGARLEATLRRADGPSAVLFVPDLGGRRTAYTVYAQLFSLDGFTTLTIDPRGHGNSRSDSLPSYQGMPQAQRDRLPADVAAAHNYLTGTLRIDPKQIVIVAAGSACTVVEHAIHEHGLAPAVVYLSPMFDGNDRDLTSALSFRPERPALVLASKEDVYAVRSLQLFQSQVTSDTVRAEVYPSAGHGALILRDPAGFADVDAWVKATLSPASQTPAQSRD